MLFRLLCPSRPAPVAAPPQFLVLVCVFSLAGCAPKAALQDQLEREVLALDQRLGMLEQDLAQCGMPDGTSRLYSSLFQVFSGSAASVDQVGPATIVSIQVSHLFTDSWGSTFRTEADSTLDLLATALLLNPEYDITVVGHVSDQPIPAAQKRRYFNHVALSLGLAARVADHLMTNYNVPQDRFTVAGRGTWDPVADNADESGRDANHRVEIRLIRSTTYTPPE